MLYSFCFPVNHSLPSAYSQYLFLMGRCRLPCRCLKNIFGIDFKPLSKENNLDGSSCHSIVNALSF